MIKVLTKKESKKGPAKAGSGLKLIDLGCKLATGNPGCKGYD